VDKDLNIILDINWDESSTIPHTGDLTHLSFCPNRASDRKRCLRYLAEIEREEPLAEGEVGLGKCMNSGSAKICRLLETR